MLDDGSYWIIWGLINLLWNFISFNTWIYIYIYKYIKDIFDIYIYVSIIQLHLISSHLSSFMHILFSKLMYSRGCGRPSCWGRSAPWWAPASSAGPWPPTASWSPSGGKSSSPARRYSFSVTGGYFLFINGNWGVHFLFTNGNWGVFFY